MNLLRPKTPLWLAGILAALWVAPGALAVSYEGTLEKSTDLQTWVPVPVTPALLDTQGRVLQDPGTRGFFRLNLVPLPAPEGSTLIPGGGYLMGDALDDSSGAPIHPVNVGACYLEKYEVTKALWDDVRTWGIAHGYDLPLGVARATTDPVNLYPVHTVSWYAVVRWCNARSEKDGRTPAYKVDGAIYKTGVNPSVTCDWTASGYRLPTEAEWERAARGGLTGKRFPNGDTLTHAAANYVSSHIFSYDADPVPGYHPTYGTGDIPYTSPVGSFPPNAYGLYDMAGNVSEWVWDWYSADYFPISPVNNPTGPASGTVRVIRGGSWFDYADIARVAQRGIFDPANGGSDQIGFRCVTP